MPDLCVICGEYCGEGRMVCLMCERRILKLNVNILV